MFSPGAAGGHAAHAPPLPAAFPGLLRPSDLREGGPGVPRASDAAARRDTRETPATPAKPPLSQKWNWGRGVAPGILVLC